MNGIIWEYDFNPSFALHIFPFTVEGNRDSLHWHQYFEIGLCRHGAGKFVYLGKVYQVKPGDLFISNNFENHVAISEDRESTEYLFVIFLPSFIADPEGAALSTRYLSLFNYNPLGFTNKIDAQEISASKLKNLIIEAFELYTKKEECFELELDIKLRQILLELIHHYSKQTEKQQPDQEFVNIRIQRAIKYLNIHYCENITLQEISEMVNLNPSYFRHLFKESMQTSFKTYITHLRLSQARKLLIATDKSVHKVILEVGYSNMSQFYRVFQKYSHMTPAEYRRHYRNEE